MIKHKGFPSRMPGKDFQFTVRHMKKKASTIIKRKRKTDALIVAAMELIIGDGSTEHGAAQFAASILKKKNEGTLLKLLRSYRSPLLPAHIRELVQTLKLEGKKRFNGKQSAIVYLKRADQNIK